MRLPLISLVLVAVGAAACSSDPAPLQRHGSTTPAPTDTTTPPIDDSRPPPAGPTAPPAGTTVPGGTWDSTKTITANITIPAGATVTIAPGAKIVVSPDVSITVAGTLVATTSATHANLTTAGAPADAPWGGIVIASGGTLTADSLDLTNVKIGVWTQAGDAAATFANGTITANTQPVNMEAGSKLSLTHAELVGSAQSVIKGELTGSYITNTKANGGFYVDDPASVVKVADSTFLGNGGDYWSVNAAASIDISYSTIAGSHCPFHFKEATGPGPTKYAIDHVSDDANNYGWMLYGSGAGPNTISNSNFRDATSNIEVSGTNGKVTLTNNFFGGAAKSGNITATTTVATVVSTAPAQIANAKPR